MDASIEEVRSELHQVQTRIRVLRLSIVGLSKESEGDDAARTIALASADHRCDVATEILDSLNDDLTLALSKRR